MLVPKTPLAPKDFYDYKHPANPNQYLAVHVREIDEPFLLSVTHNGESWGWRVDPSLLPEDLQKWIKDARERLRFHFLDDPVLIAFEGRAGAKWEPEVCVEGLCIDEPLVFTLRIGIFGLVLKQFETPRRVFPKVVGYGLVTLDPPMIS